MKKRTATPPRYVLLDGRCAVTGKVRYPSEYDAINAAVELAFAPTARILRPYMCMFCMRWHLTRDQRRQR